MQTGALALIDFFTLQTDSMQTFKLTLEYEGSRYSDWQKPVNARTVQSELKQPALNYVATESRMSFKV